MSVLRHDDAKTQRIHDLPLFKDADKKALQHLTSAVDEIDVRAGSVVITQGHRHQEGYIIISGEACVEIDGEEVAVLPGGELVGELGLFGHGPASATVRAKTDLKALVIPYNRFMQILEDNPTLTLAIAKQLAGRLFAMDSRHGETVSRHGETVSRHGETVSRHGETASEENVT